MKLTRKKAIELCIELWTWLADTGKFKEDWPGWEKYGYDISCDCWFCEYQEQQVIKHNPDNKMNKEGLCRYCPLTKIKVDCVPIIGRSLYFDWKHAQTPRTRKKYAKLFLAQIRSLK